MDSIGASTNRPQKRHTSSSPLEYMPQILHLWEALELFLVCRSTMCISSSLASLKAVPHACAVVLGEVLVSGKIASLHRLRFLQVWMAEAVVAKMDFAFLSLVSLVQLLHHCRFFVVSCCSLARVSLLLSVSLSRNYTVLWWITLFIHHSIKRLPFVQNC